jgi:hypothetical protein
MPKVKQPSETLRTQIKNSRKEISESSVNAYIISLRMLHDSCFEKHNGDQLDPKFLHNFNKIETCLNEITNKNTRKNRLTAILVALDSEKDPDKKLIDKYQTVLKTLMIDVNKTINSQQKSDTQKTNWIEYDDIKKVLNKMLEDINKDKLFSKEKLSKSEYGLIQKYVLLRFYVSHPMRNNVSDTRVLSQKDYDDLKEDDKNSHNYLIREKNNYKFMLNNFKNVKRIGAKIISIDDNIAKLLTKWLKINTSGFMFTLNNGKEALTSNGVTKIMNSIFSEYADGKKISTSMLRHISISDDLKNELTIAEKKKKENAIETKYQHSSSMNDTYRKI